MRFYHALLVDLADEEFSFGAAWFEPESRAHGEF